MGVTSQSWVVFGMFVVRWCGGMSDRVTGTIPLSVVSIEKGLK